MTVSPRTLLQQALDALENSYLSDELRNYELQAKAIAALREALAADHLRDIAEKVGPAAPVPDGMVMVPRKELGDGISLLHQAMVGACDCLTKTHEAKYHAESCFYRRLSEQCDKLEATIAASPAAPLVPDLKHCACEFDGDTCITQCKLHAAHVDTIHEWAERAKAAEAKLPAAPVVREPFSRAQLHRLYVNSPELHKDTASEAAFTRIVQLTEAAHGITGASK